MNAIQSSLSVPSPPVRNSSPATPQRTTTPTMRSTRCECRNFPLKRAHRAESLETTSVFAFHKLLTGKLTGTPTNFSGQSRTSVNKIPLYRPLGGRPRTSTDSRCRIPHFDTLSSHLRLSHRDSLLALSLRQGFGNQRCARVS